MEKVINDAKMLKKKKQCQLKMPFLGVRAYKSIFSRPVLTNSPDIANVMTSEGPK